MKWVKEMLQKQQIQLSKKQEKLLEYMAENPIHSVSELEYKFNASRTYVLELLNLCYTYYLEENGNSDKDILKQEKEINTIIISNERKSVEAFIGKEIKEEELDIKEEVLSVSNYSESDSETDIDEDMPSKEEDVVPTYFEVPIVLRYPVVRTTRLDNMCILQKNIRRRKRENIIRKIYSESKNIWKDSKHGYNKRCTCSNTKHKMTFKKLQNKLSVLSSNRKVLLNNENYSIVPEKRTNDIIDISSDEEVLSNKIKRKKEENSNSILSDKLKKVNVVIKEPSVIEQYVCENLNKEPPAIDNYTLLVNYLLKLVDIKIIEVMHMNDSNVVIIINNIYSQLTEIYVTDINNTIFEFVTVRYGDYSLIYKLFNCTNKNESIQFLNKGFRCRLLRMNCCCWIKRQKEVKFRFPKEFAKFLSTPHTCSLICSCCCNERKEQNDSDKSRLEVAKVDTNFSSMLYGVGVSKISSKNPLVQAALNFDKPKQIQHNLMLTKYTCPVNFSAALSIHFKFINSTSRKSKDVLADRYEFIELGTKREVVFHDLNLSVLSNIDRILVSIKETSKYVCCKYSLRCLLKDLCVLYNLNPNVLKYIDDVHNSTIFKKEICTFGEKCTKCQYRNDPDDDGTKISVSFKTVSAPIEHIRKSIIGKIVIPKTGMLEQTKHMEEKSKTIQEMMVKLEEKFPNISFFINEVGLPVASLPMPYHCYPIDDFKILTQVLEFAQSKIMSQQLPAGTEVKLKHIQRNKVNISQITDSPTIEPVTVSTQISSEMPNNNSDEQFAMQTTELQSYDFCSILIKCNKTSYMKSFESFINTYRNECTEEILLPTITNVCSLSENDEIAKQLYNVATDEENIDIIDDD